MDLALALVDFYRTLALELPAPLFGVVLFLVAGMVGSFLNVCVWRIPRGQSIVTPRSRCPRCGHLLGLPDLVPVLSWAASGGKCRYCAAPIALRYQLVELVNISIWMACWAAFGRSLRMLAVAITGSAVFGTMGVVAMTHRLRAAGPGPGEADAPGGGVAGAPRGDREAFTFLEIVVTVAILAAIVAPFLGTTQVAYMGSGKNREYLMAFNLCREKLEELRTVPLEKLRSDWEVYVQGETNIFADEFFGPYARMKQSPENFYEGFSDLWTEDKQLTDSVMRKFREVFKGYQGFEYELYPPGYKRFRRYTKVEDLTEEDHPNNELKKITVTVIIESRTTKHREVRLMGYATNR